MTLKRFPIVVMSFSLALCHVFAVGQDKKGEKKDQSIPGNKDDTLTAKEKSEGKEANAKVVDRLTRTFALIVGVGFHEGELVEDVRQPNDKKVSSETVTLVKDVLANNWGFSDIKTLVNEQATKKAIWTAFGDLLGKVTSLKPDGVKACYVKVHLQGHGAHRDPRNDQDLKVKSPDASEDHESVRTWDAQKVDGKIGFLHDFELADQLKKLSDALKKFDANQLIVQVDFCWAERIFDAIKPLPANMSVAWAAGRNSTCAAEAGGPFAQATPWTQGFRGAFISNGGEASAKVSVEVAHKSASLGKAQAFNPGYEPKGGPPIVPAESKK